MNLDHIEKEALELNDADRAKLAQKILISLENTSAFMEANWLKDACEKAKEAEQSETETSSSQLTADELKKRSMHFLDELKK